MYCLFGDNMNFTHATAALLSRNLPFAAAFFVRQRYTALSPVLAQKLQHCELLDISSMERATALATAVFRALDDKLEQSASVSSSSSSSSSTTITVNSFFAAPSSIDATITAYALLVRHARLPRNPLAVALAACTRVVALVDAVVARSALRVEMHVESVYFNVERVRRLQEDEVRPVRMVKVSHFSV
jgi:hypothetical protein